MCFSLKGKKDTRRERERERERERHKNGNMQKERATEIGNRKRKTCNTERL